MKDESSNPVYPHFKHLLSQVGRYPARHIDIFLNLTDEWTIKDVEVVFVPREALADQELQTKFTRYNRQWVANLGNCTEQWLKEDGYTPERIFGRFLHHRFASDAETRRALQEFGHIEECEWARLMLRGFEDRYDAHLRSPPWAA
jgi:hypothetical protein